MFEQSTLSSAPAGKRFWTTCIGFTGQAGLLSFAFLAPMLWPQILPRAAFLTMLTPPGTPPPPPAHEHAVVRPRGARVPPQLWNGGIVAPRAIPETVQILVDPPPEPGYTGVVGAPDQEQGGNGHAAGWGAVPGSGVPAAPPPIERPHAAAAPSAAPAEPVRIRGGVVKMAQVLHRVEPEYPQIARQMRLQGVVELTGVIGTDGRMREVRVLSGHPMLAQAALKAVSQWIYEPTTLNGVPVEVMGPITVTFRLN